MAVCAKSSTLLFIFLLSQFYLFAQGSPLQPATLKCERIQNPLGIDNKNPLLSWQFTATARDQIQSAYEIIVSDSKESIDNKKGNIWSSGKITGSQHRQIEMKGIDLKSFTRYYWRVRVYNGQDAISNWSEFAWFETAMLHSEDWKASWISDGSIQPSQDEEYYKDDPMPLFRKEFVVQKKITNARLYISGLGYYESFLNGNKIGDHELDPGFTTYRKQVLYTVYDITSILKKGKNAIGIMVGNGWYNPLPMRLFGRIDLRKYLFTGRPCVKAEIHLHFSDGTLQKIN